MRFNTLINPPLVGAASRFCLTDVWPRMGVLGERMTEESYATLRG